MADATYISMAVSPLSPPSQVTTLSSTFVRRSPPPSAVTAVTTRGSTTVGGMAVPSGSDALGANTDELGKNISNTKRVWTGLIAGAVAGAIAKSVIAPLDRTKIYFQIHKTPYSVREAWNFLQKTARTEGFLGLWRGNSATMARIAPYAAIQFTSHEQWKRLLGLNVASPIDHSEDAHMKRFLAGSLAGVTSQTLTYPLDLARARMAVTNKEMYSTLRSVFRLMWKQESLQAFYRGYIPTLLGVIPYAGLSFLTYDTLKHHYKVYLGDEEPNPLLNLAFGAVAGAIGQTGSYPLDIVRRRMQTAQVTGEQYRTIVGTLQTIYREEGIKGGFYKGLSMNWVKGPVAVGISFSFNDMIRDHLRQLSLF